MGKRSRENSISVKGVFDKYKLIEYDGQQYLVFDKHGNITDMFDIPEYSCEIIHNKWNESILNVENLRSGEILLRQEVNLVKYKYIE